MAEITDPDILKQFGAPTAPSGLVTDPEILKQFGITPDAEKPSVAADVAKSGGIGLAKGAIAGVGAAGDIRGLASAATDYLGKKLGASPEAIQSFKNKAADVAGYSPIGTILANAPSSGDIQKGVESVTGDFYKPQTTAGKYAETTGEFAGNPMTYMGPGSMLAKGATAAVSGLGSEAAGQIAEANKSKYAPLYRLAGAVAGGHAVGTTPAIISPNVISPERQAMLDVLQNEGVTATTAGQRIGSKPLKYTESVMADQPFAGQNAEQINEQVSNQFTRATLRRAGENADRATPEVVDRVFNRIGNRFDTLAANNTMALDPQIQNDLLNTTIDYHNNVNPLMRSPIVENTMNDIATWAGQQGGQLTGRQYQNLRSRLAAASRGSNDPQLSHALQDMSEHLDDAMERSIAVANPQDAGQFADARRQYRNMLVIERAATSGGAENVGQGIITPAALSTAVKTTLGRRSFARGQDEFTDLARAGTGVLTPLPQSGTGPRENIIHHLQLAGLLGAEPAAAAAGAHWPGMIAAGLGGLVAPALAGRAIMSRPVQGYLANQAAPFRMGTSPTMEALVNQIKGQPPAEKNGRLYVAPHPNEVVNAIRGQ